MTAPEPARIPTGDAVTVARHVKAALMHLRAAEDAMVAAGVDLDGEGGVARLDRQVSEALDDLDTWAINTAVVSGADRRLTYTGTNRWCHAPGGVLPVARSQP